MRWGEDDRNADLVRGRAGAGGVVVLDDDRPGLLVIDLVLDVDGEVAAAPAAAGRGREGARDLLLVLVEDDGR